MNERTKLEVGDVLVLRKLLPSLYTYVVLGFIESTTVIMLRSAVDTSSPSGASVTEIATFTHSDAVERWTGVDWEFL